ncbi:MAG: hypothetical protein HFI93_05325 [Lachnospiraceae bacterium]|nr:hypothetical protein [Lachnospiraceae bacterium]
MEYGEFLTCVKRRLEEAMPQARVELHHIMKNNQVTWDGVTILPEGETISPTVYLNEFYGRYRAGMSMEEIVRRILAEYQENCCQPGFDVSRLKEFAYLKDRIVFKLINYEENRELLEEMPHRRVLDLAMVFYFMLEDEALGLVTALIFNSHLKVWKVDEETLYQTARENTPRLLNWELQSMDSLLDEMILQDMREEFESEEAFEEFCGITLGRDKRSASPMYVLTNKERFNGAGCMLYQDVLDRFAREHNSDIYVLPSSIHEVILIPCVSSPGREDLCDMVREINSTEVAATDRLSDHVYCYSLSEGILKL